MARKTQTQTRTGASGGEPVKISVSLDADTHMRLRALALVRRTTGSEIVAALIAGAVSGVQLPSVAGDGG